MAAQAQADVSVSVSVIVPSIGTTGSVRGVERVFVIEAVRSVLATVGPEIDLEVIVVSGREMPQAVERDLIELGGGASASNRVVRCVDYDAAFNFSATVNLGAAHASGDHLLLLNDDTEATAPGWLAAMLDAAAMPDVGAVGARLLFEDGTLQHAGHTYRTSLDHVGFGLPGDAAGRDGILHRRRRVAGVTAACLLTPMRVFELVGGFSTSFPGNYNDVDFCMKVRASGHDIVYEPDAVLSHFESKSRVTGILPEEIERIQRRWLTGLVDDPFTPVAI
jgi:O-antigen biosynthesis protein